jgi:predicted esterase
LKSWSRRSAAACATISLLAAGGLRAQPKPAIVLPDPRDAAMWQKWTAELGWQLIAPAIDSKTDADTRAIAVAEAVRAAVKNSTVDAAHVYLAGRGDDAAMVFYIVSRIPDLWSAALALGGSPKPALAGGRVFGANFTNTPVLWISDAPGDGELASRLKSVGLNVDWRDAKGVTIAKVFEELGNHTHIDFPSVADCETNTAKFAKCYWLEPTKFDAGERNDVLPNTRVIDGSGAALDLGGFGYKLTDPGPGVLISYLPKDYYGPLKTGDRLIELDGAPVEDARDFDARLNRMYAEKAMVALIQRGKERLRLDTRVILPRPDAIVTARVQGKYDPEFKTVQIISRSVSEMRVTIPQQWTPSDLYWNGLAIEDLAKPGCYLLTIDRELLNAAPCPQ